MAMPRPFAPRRDRGIIVPRCPRCGYDQRGVIATWADACPMRGTCAECGLEFDWAEVLSDRVRLPRWSVEGGRTRMGRIGRIAGTLAVSFAPWTFWRSLRMTNEVRWRRIALYLLAWFALPYIVFALGHGRMAWIFWRDVNAQPGVTTQVTPWQTIAWSIALPLSEHSPGQVTEPARFRMGVSATTGNAARQVSPSVIASDYPSPRDLFRFRNMLGGAAGAEELFLFLISNDAFISRRFDWQAPWLLILAAAAITLLCPAGFACLPASLRAARVRRSHIARIALYSLAFLLVPLLMLAIETARLRTWSWSYHAFATQLRFICLFAVPGMLAVWWSLAAGRYLRLPHAAGVGAAVVALAYLATALALTAAFLIALR